MPRRRDEERVMCGKTLPDGSECEGTLTFELEPGDWSVGQHAIAGVLGQTCACQHTPEEQTRLEDIAFVQAWEREQDLLSAYWDQKIDEARGT